MFKRVSLTGSAELFRDTSQAPEFLAETDPERAPAPIHELPVVEARTPTFAYNLTEAEVRELIDAVQKIKYPHTVKSAAKLSMEEFERLEALRQVLLDGLR